MSDDETPDTLVPSSDMLLLLPCAGVERKTGQFTARTVAEFARKNGPSKLQLEPSFPQISTNNQRFGTIVQQARIIAIDGCGQKCVSKLLHELNVKPFGTFAMPQLLREKKLQLRPGITISLEEEKMVPEIAQSLIEKIQEIIKKKEEVNSKIPTMFNPIYEDWLEYRQSKFIFKVPVKRDGFYFNWNDVWAYQQEGILFVGISDYIQKNIGDVTIVELPKIGDHIDQLESLGSIETVKTVIDIIAPFSGKVVNINQDLVDAPEKINQSPYGEGWICTIEASDFRGELENLMSPADYFTFMKGKIDEEAKKQK